MASESGTTSFSPAPPGGGAVAVLAGLLLTALDALAQAGGIEAACRLAGRACVALREGDPAIARRFDVFLHRLTPKLTWTQPPRMDTPDPHPARPPQRNGAQT